jgi:hypothetical protein
MRADEEAPVGDQSGALPDRALPDRVAKDNGCNGRPGGGDALAHPRDTTSREPDQLDEPASLTTNPARHILEHGSTVPPAHSTAVAAATAEMPTIGTGKTPLVGGAIWAVRKWNALAD